MEMQAVSATYGIERGSVLAIAAGADAICVGGGLCDEDTVLRLRDALVNAVRTGELPEERLADAAARVRALAAWTQAHRARGLDRCRARRCRRDRARRRRRTRRRPPGPEGDPRGASVHPGHQRPYVASFTPVANFAVGDETPWGIAAELERLLPGTETGSYDETTADTALAAAGSGASWRSYATSTGTRG